MNKFTLSSLSAACLVLFACSASSDNDKQTAPSINQQMTQASQQKPNVVVLYADDISARELAIYGSSKWSGYRGKSVSDRRKLADIPVIEKMANQGAFIENAWASTVCSPSRAMMMTGRYASIHKWWHNGDVGVVLKPGQKQTYTPKENISKEERTSRAVNGPRVTLFESSPLQIGHLAQKAGYATMWSGKTQMPSWDKYGFDEGALTPGERPRSKQKNPYTDFNLITKKVQGKRVLVNEDTGKVLTRKSYAQNGWYWQPSVTLMNHPSNKEQFEFWPNTAASKKEYGVNTFGPDVEVDFIFDFMERQHAKNKPFFVYHTSHLGHDAFDWLHPDSEEKWPGTPVVKWDGEKYTRITPNITGDNGVYDTHGTVTEPSMAAHVKYLDYQVWLYLQKFKQMGIENDTIFIFAADNGTSGYGKASHNKQEGTHVPLIIYAPGANMTKHGKQPVLASMADILPTLADIMGEPIPADYQVHGESLWPFLTTNKKEHRAWNYAYKNYRQLIRGKLVMKDGADKWWDVSVQPDDLTSFPMIKDWSKVSQAHRDERDKLKAVLPRFDNYELEHDFIAE
ncbi:sulfatase-like hydrolase/transferase [Paraglaciecola aquimarina]|uniref:Sulfatase-like hydrolase/transferase n=1 Tax=Paraglaciecola aquimarina TaxID=1235557 RepID=A0ABU3SYB4_9ALTE|nr:sulfatase-like hydrolase/transferase [Paraglaciecola aquimarina]MDU0355000.1 sulfatase-like hydrolase/transferase [Paraglaciecola aquimarina]